MTATSDRKKVIPTVPSMEVAVGRAVIPVFVPCKNRLGCSPEERDSFLIYEPIIFLERNIKGHCVRLGDQ